jgi:hypothetical protein
MKLQELYGLDRLAKVSMKKHNLRYSQALWNLLPVEVADELRDKGKDFYYLEDGDSENIIHTVMSFCEDYDNSWNLGE